MIILPWSAQQQVTHLHGQHITLNGVIIVSNLELHMYHVCDLNLSTFAKPLDMIWVGCCSSFSPSLPDISLLARFWQLPPSTITLHTLSCTLALVWKLKVYDLDRSCFKKELYRGSYVHVQLYLSSGGYLIMRISYNNLFSLWPKPCLPTAIYVWDYLSSSFLGQNLTTSLTSKMLVHVTKNYNVDFLFKCSFHLG